VIRIDKGNSSPPILSDAGGRGRLATQRFCDDFDRGIVDFDFDSGIYGHDSVKQALIEAQRGKCCFCESTITHISYGDVEHFRPKAGFIQQDGDSFTKPGYYWLAYEWSNLFLACQICNQRHKKNLFPLTRPANRARSHRDDVSRERAVFVHPVDEDPERFITFREFAAIPKNRSTRGKRTIDALELNRQELAIVRRDIFEFARAVHLARQNLLALAKTQPGGLSPAQQSSLDEFNRIIRRSLLPESQYSSMMKALAEAMHFNEHL